LAAQVVWGITATIETALIEARLVTRVSAVTIAGICETKAGAGTTSKTVKTIAASATASSAACGAR
jgi:hypothetical protein